MRPRTELEEQPWEQWPCSLIRTDANGLVVAANPRFLARTGYRRGDVIGRMQWTELLSSASRLFYETQLAPVLALGGSLEEVMVDLMSATGQRLPALMNAESVVEKDGLPGGARIAIVTVPDRREYEDSLRQARSDAERSNRASTQARGRLELLAAANTALASSVDVEVALNRLARTLVRHVADWCLIYTIDESHPDVAPHWAAAHADAARQEVLERLADLLPIKSTGSTMGRVLRRRKGVLLDQVTPQQLQDATGGGEGRDIIANLDPASAMIVPSLARGVQVATLILVRGADRPPFTEDDLADLRDLGSRTGVVIDNLRLYARERNNSLALQHALLTAPPDIAPFSIVTRYLPATEGAEVGGDWYDAFAQPGGGVAVVIGDVMGHDIAAAAAMGQLRGVIRTIANAIAGAPADTLARADRAAHSLQIGVLASAILAQVEPQPSDVCGGRIVLWSNAGHPPPVLITHDGEIRILENPSDPLLGVDLDATRHDHSIDLHAGDTLLLYTDGLIERRGEDIDAGLARLIASLAGGQRLTLGQLCDAVLAQHHGDRRDDIALLALRVAD